MTEKAFIRSWLSLSKSSSLLTGSDYYCSFHSQSIPFASISLRMEFNDPWMISSHSVLRQRRRGDSLLRSRACVCLGSEALGLATAMTGLLVFFLLDFFSPTKQAMLSWQRLNEILSGKACSSLDRSFSISIYSPRFFCFLAFMPKTFK